ncbi:PAS domain S-box protein [Prosthecobacter fluviatilis]|uniref:histidine kinase n=1 Tax=Prosthecobacter fluviatilis TaxID=445931 RepID=A0ABW0KQ88_9BACT
MNHKRNTTLLIRLASIAILGLLIALAAMAYYSGRQVETDSDLIAQDAVPGTINAHYMRMAMSRSIGWLLVAASAQSVQSRDAALKIVHEADVTYADALERYETTIRMNPGKDRALLDQLKSSQAAFNKKRTAYEALVLTGDRDACAAYLEREMVPAFQPAILAAEDLIKYNHSNSIVLSSSIRSSVHYLYWVVAVVLVLALACAAVLLFNLTIRRREVKQLRENEEKFSKAFQANPSGIAITEIETGRYIEVNESFCRILGYPPEEVIGYTTLDKGIWPSEAACSQFIQPLLDGGSLRHQELPVRTRGGIRKTISLNAELIELAGKKCVVTLIEDITERKQSEAALQAGEERLRHLIKHTPAAVAMFDTELRYLQVSDRWITDYHLEGKEIIGRHHYEVFPDIPERWKEIHRQALGGKPQSCSEDMFTRADGGVEWLQWEIQPWHAAGKVLGGVIFFTQVITERKLNEIRLRKSEELFRASFESATDGVCLVSASGRFINANRTLCAMLGYTKEEMLQLTFNDVTHKDDLDIGLSFISKSQAGGPKTMRTEKRYLHKDGHVIWALLSTAVIDDAHEHGAYLISHIQDITKRKRLEQKQTELASIVESSDDAIIGKTLEGVVTSWNRGAEKIFGYTAEEAIGQPLLMLLPPERHHEEAEILARISRGETVKHFDTVRLCKDGRKIFISATISPLKDASGKVIGASKIARDITEQKRTEEALARSEELLRHLIKHTPAAVAMFDTEMRYLQASDRWITDYHLGGKEILGRSHYELFPDIPERWKEIHRRALLGQPASCDEDMFQQADGTVDWLQWEVRPWHASENVIGGLIIFAQVITERKRTESKLRESEELFRSSFESATVGVCLVAADGRFINVNPTLCSMLGYSKDELIRLTFKDITHADDKDIGRDFLSNALNGGPKAMHAEKRYLHKNGEVVWAYLSTALIDQSREHGSYLISYVQDITERKRAEESLASTTELLERTSAMAKVGGWELDLASQRVTWSEETARIHEVEFPYEQPLLEKATDFYGPDAWPAIEAAVQAAIVHGTSYDLESPFITAKGNHIWVRVQGFAVIENGKTTKLRGTFQDITAKKQAELRIRHLNRVYEVLSNINQTIVHEKDPQVILTRACEIAVSKGGFRMAWVGMHDAATQKLQPVASAGVVEGYLDNVNIDLSDQTRSCGPTGSCFLSGQHVTCSDMENDPRMLAWRDEALKRGYRSSASFPITVGGRVSGTLTLYSGETGFFDEVELRLLDELALDIGFALEVSEGEAGRRQAEQELRWRTAFFEAQVHSAIDGILVVDSDGKKLLQNRRMNELWKIPPHIADDPDDSRQVQFVLGQVKDPEVFLQKITHLNAHPDESSTDVIEQVDGTTLERHSAPVRGTDGTYYGRVWTFHDITERKKLEAQFLRAQRMESIGTLASGVAHDLNNILTPIMMSVAVLRMKLSEEKRSSLCDTIEMSAARGAQIVRQVLAFGRGLEGERHPLQIEMLLTEMEQMIRSTFPKDITVECVNAPNLRLVLGDATQLHQVLLNLCVNARDAMPEGGRLRLSAANLDIDTSYASMLPEITPGPHVLVEVSDTGSGIPPEILERIFDPFFTTKEIGKGTGLGLSTVHGIVKSHGGLLKVVTAPGAGATFQIYLPAAPDQEAIADISASAAAPTGHGECVLVVDDEVAIANAARTVLEANGYRVLLANNATEALVLHTEHSQEVALILTDIMMPVLNGVLFLRTLRKINPDVPVIASTGLCNQAQLDTMKSLGVETVLYKPYNSNMLLRTIDGVLHPKA